MYYSFTFIPYQYVSEGSLVTLSEVGSRARPPFSLNTDRNTWEHWRIVPSSRPSIAPATIKTNYIDIAGASGKTDLSQVLTGYPLYDDRSGTIDYVVMNDFRNWQEAYTDILTSLHNRKMIAIYEEDPEYFYVGRWSVSEWKTGDNYSNITFSYVLEPYKWRLYDSTEAWLWNPFNFKTGVISSRSSAFNKIVETNSTSETTLLDCASFLEDLEVITDHVGTGKFDTQETLASIVGNAPIVPRFTIERLDNNPVDVTLHFTNPEANASVRNVEINVKEPKTNHEFPEIIMTNWTGTNTMKLTVSGVGKVSWVYRPGRL